MSAIVFNFIILNCLILGEFITTITPCPAGHICTADRQICRLPSEGFTPICYEETCGTCDQITGDFICLDQTTYSYCFGRYSTVAYSCPPGFVCNIYASEVCVPAATNRVSRLMMEYWILLNYIFIFFLLALMFNCHYHCHTTNRVDNRYVN